MTKIVSWVCVSFLVLFLYSVVKGEDVRSSFIADQVAQGDLG